MIGPITPQIGFTISRASDVSRSDPSWHSNKLQTVQTESLLTSNEGSVSDILPVGASAVIVLGHVSSFENSKVDLTFRQYRLVPTARLLLREGQPVKIGSRAFDLLQLLLCSRGILVSKQVIVDHVWPDTTVEESNLRFQMGCLRKALGSDRDLIITIPGRGYIFAADLPAGSVHAKADDAHPAEGEITCLRTL